MSEPRACPECGSWDTEKVHTEDYDGLSIEIIKICNECPTQYTLVYALENEKVDYTKE